VRDHPHRIIYQARLSAPGEGCTPWRRPRSCATGMPPTPSRNANTVLGRRVVWLPRPPCSTRLGKRAGTMSCSCGVPCGRRASWAPPRWCTGPSPPDVAARQYGPQALPARPWRGSPYSRRVGPRGRSRLSSCGAPTSAPQTRQRTGHRDHSTIRRWRRWLP